MKLCEKIAPSSCRGVRARVPRNNGLLAPMPKKLLDRHTTKPSSATIKTIHFSESSQQYVVLEQQQHPSFIFFTKGWFDFCKMEETVWREVSDFHTVCSKCDTAGENKCQYWLHPVEYYGRSRLERIYCDACIRVFELYDGRKEVVCSDCVHYVNALITFPKLVKVMEKLHELASEYIT